MITEVMAGLITGIISGLGIGGGSVLMMYMSVAGYEHFNSVGINLSYFVCCAIPVVIKNVKNRFIDIAELLWVIIPATVISVVVTLIVTNFDSSLLRRGFGIFAIAVGIKELIRKNGRS